MEAKLARRYIPIVLLTAAMSVLSPGEKRRSDLAIQDLSQSSEVTTTTNQDIISAELTNAQPTILKANQTGLLRSEIESSINYDLQIAFAHRFNYVGNPYTDIYQNQAPPESIELDSHMMFDLGSLYTNPIFYHAISHHNINGDLLDLTIYTSALDIWNISRLPQKPVHKLNLATINKDRLVEAAFNLPPTRRDWRSIVTISALTNNATLCWQAFTSLPDNRSAELELEDDFMITMRIQY